MSHRDVHTWRELSLRVLVEPAQQMDQEAQGPESKQGRLENLCQWMTTSESPLISSAPFEGADLKMRTVGSDFPKITWLEPRPAARGIPCSVQPFL